MNRLKWKRQPDGSYEAGEWSCHRATTLWELYRNLKLAVPYGMTLRQAQFKAQQMEAENRQIRERALEALADEI